MRRVLLGIAGIALAGIAVVVVEVVLAVRGRNLPPRPPFRLDGRIGPRAGDPLAITWLGDSTGAGVGASGPDAALPRVVAEELRRPVDLVVAARSGARLDDLIGEQLVALRSTTPDVVVLGIGSNDVTHLTSNGTFAARYEQLLRTAEVLAPKAAIVTVGIGNYGSVPRFAQPLRTIAGWRAATLDAEVQDAARRHGAAYVDIRAETGEAFAAQPDRYYAADGYHPNDAGYRLWAQAILDVLRPLVDARFPVPA